MRKSETLFLVVQSAKHTARDRHARSFRHTSYPRALGKLVLICLFLDSSEVVKIHRKTAQSAITQFKVQFARHGIAEVLITDNGSEFDNQELKNYYSQWHFEHRTSCPRYPQSNGKVENDVKTCKGLLVKAKEDKKDPL